MLDGSFRMEFFRRYPHFLTKQFSQLVSNKAIVHPDWTGLSTPSTEGTPVSELRQANGLSSSRIYPGKVLRIPSSIVILASQPNFSLTKSMLQYREWTPTLPDELSTMTAIITAPPEPFVPKELVGTQMIIVALCYLGSKEEGEKAMWAWKI